MLILHLKNVLTLHCFPLALGIKAGILSPNSYMYAHLALQSELEAALSFSWTDFYSLVIKSLLSSACFLSPRMANALSHAWRLSALSYWLGFHMHKFFVSEIVTRLPFSTQLHEINFFQLLETQAGLEPLVLLAHWFTGYVTMPG